MAENESLDLGSSPRMRVVFDAFRSGSSCREVASKLEKALVGGIQLLARHRDEWMKIASAARERGHAWARLLASQRPDTQGVTNASA